MVGVVAVLVVVGSGDYSAEAESAIAMERILAADIDFHPVHLKMIQFLAAQLVLTQMRPEVEFVVHEYPGFQAVGLHLKDLQKSTPREFA